jgi:hypothetical protein
MAGRDVPSSVSGCLGAILLVLLVPVPAAADGLVFEVSGRQDSVEIDHQRALIWQRQDALELVIEPVFRWTPGDPGAWIIPFPALPVVAAGVPSFLDRLERLTAPQFVDVCMDPSCCCYWQECDASMPGTQELATSDGVTVWTSGTVGDLDYVVLSVAEGNLLATWLASNGFQVPPEVAPTLDGLDVVGVYWFAARVANPATAGQSLAPVSFTFPPTVAPFYPMRLTLAGMTEGEQIELHLFTVTDGPAPLVPGDVPWTRADQATGHRDYFGFSNGHYCQDNATPVAYVEQARALLSGKSSFLLEAYGSIADRLEETDVGGPFDLLQGSDARIARLWGAMTASTEASDVPFVALVPPDTWGWEQDRFFPTYCNDKGFCHGCDNNCDQPPPEIVETSGDVPLVFGDVADAGPGVDDCDGDRGIEELGCDEGLEEVGSSCEIIEDVPPTAEKGCSGHPQEPHGGRPAPAIALILCLAVACRVRRRGASA